MKILKTLLLPLFIVILNLSGISQNTFENRYYIDNNSEFRFVKETMEGEYILLASSDENDCIIKLSHEGDSIGMFNYSIPEGNLRFFGLFNHPYYENVMIAPAVIKQTNANKIALLSFEMNLDVVDVKIVSFENDIMDFSNRQIPISLMNEDKIEFAVLARSLSGDYCHMFVSIDVDGNIIKQRIIKSFSITNTLEYTERSYPSNFLIINNKYTQYLYSYFKEYPKEGMDGFFDRKLYIGIMDDDFNVRESKELDEYHDYENLLIYVDLPKIRCLNDSTLVLQILAQNIYKELQGIAYITLDKELNILNKNFLMTHTMVKLPLLNSIEITNDYIMECKIVNFSGVLDYDHPTEIYISKYGHDLNPVWETIVSTKERYCCPLSISKTVDDGYIILGKCMDPKYNRGFLHVIKVDENGVLSIDEEIVNRNKVYSFYPNPVKDKINIRFSPDVSCERVDVYSLDGRLCHTQNFNMQTVNIDHLNSGVYVMNITLDNGTTYTDRIVVY